MRLAQYRRRGVALLLSLAILAVLAILATTFTRLMIMEHNAATNYVAAARADALANAGLDYALGQIRLKARNQHWSWFSEGYGTTTTGTADAPVPAQRWIYKMRVVDAAPSNFYETLGAGLPLEFAAYPPGIKSGGGPHIYGGPSFYKGNTAVDDSTDVILGTYPAGETAEYEVYSAKIAAKGRGQAISGWIGGSLYKDGPLSKFVAGTYESWGDTFRLKALDCSSMVNVNMDTTTIKTFVNHVGEEVDYFWRTRHNKAGGLVTRSLAELGEFGYRYTGLYIVTHLATKSLGLGDWLIAIRDLKPNKVFLSKDEILTELRKELGTGMITIGATTLRGDQIAREDYNKLKDFLTCYGFRDTTVLEPGSLMTAQLYEADASLATKYKEARTPINMNTVSNPVLTAWLRGISYNKYTEADLSAGTSTSSSVAFDSKFGAAKLRNIAFRFRRMTYFTPLLAWKGLKSVLEGNPTVESQAGDATANAALRTAFISEISSLDPYDRDAWLAMADPNATLNKWNPDWLIRRLVDKYDLSGYTTEMSFNSMGYYEIYSLGTVTNNGGAIVADRKVRGVYQIFDMVYKTTQRDFEISRLKIGRDVTSNTDVDLHVGNWWGIATYPEYRTKFLEYSETATGSGKYDSSDPSTYGYVALYDGHLQYNALDKHLFYTDEFGAGFSYPLFKNSESGKNALDGIRPTGTSSKYKRTTTSFTSATSIVSSSERKRMATPSSTAPLKYSKVTGGGAAALARFHSGSDAFPMGFFSDNLRKRALAYDAQLVKGGNAGAIQFWVKPRFEEAYDKESWFYWEDTEGQSIWVFREGKIIYFYFSIGTVSDGRLQYDTALDPDYWGKAGRWHHIHLDWGRSGRVFVNGKEATGGGYRGPNTTDFPKPEARHLEFGGWPPATAEAMLTFSAYPTKYKSALEWIEQHIPRTDKRYTYAKSGTEMWVGYGDESKDPKIATSKDLYANATIDNVLITTWRIFKINQVEMPFGTLPFRYYPRTYHSVSRFYWQDISSHFAGYGRDISLGTVAWTNWHSDKAFVRVYLQVEDLDAQEAVAG